MPPASAPGGRGMPAPGGSQAPAQAHQLTFRRRGSRFLLSQTPALRTGRVSAFTKSSSWAVVQHSNAVQYCSYAAITESP
jgi:hypothetical protein